MSSRTSVQNSPPDFNESILKKSIKSEKSYSSNDKVRLSTDKRDPVSTSSYKFLSWREKDRRRRFRDEWKHLWLVIPHGNFEVMCLVCHKVMTQRKLDTIKRHTLRRHTEILDMDQGERIILFEKLFLEHNSQKFQQKNNNNNGLTDATIENSNPDSETIDLEKLLSSDCVSATSSSSSLSPTESRQNNGDLKFFSKRGKYSRKNIKINIKSNQKVDLMKTFSLKTAVENKTGNKSNIKVPHIVDNKSFSVWSTTNSSDRLLPQGNNKTFSDSFFNKFNGSSCLNFLPPMPVMSKCPLCLEDCSQNGTDTNNANTRIMAHIQQKHADKFPSPIPSFDLNQFGGTTANDLLKLQSLLLPPTATNTNYMSISNAISNANFISLLYYQELLRQNVPATHTPAQYGSVSSNSMYYQQTPPSSNPSSMFPLFSSPSPQCSLRPSSSIPPAFVLPTLSEMPRIDRPDQIHNTFDDPSSNLDKFSPFKRARFSTESLISEANKQSAFYNPKSSRIDEKDLSYHAVANLPLSLSTHSSTTELSNLRCKEPKVIKEETVLIDPSKFDVRTSPLKTVCEPNIERSLTPKSAAQGTVTCHALRFGPGQDLKAALLEYMKRKKISAAFVMSCCGSISRATLRMANSGIPNTALEIKTFNKHFKIVSLVGSIFENGCHLHISLADSNGHVIGGHIVSDVVVHSTAEIMIGQICGVQMRREQDDVTGYSELSFTSVETS